MSSADQLVGRPDQWVGLLSQADDPALQVSILGALGGAGDAKALADGIRAVFVEPAHLSVWVAAVDQAMANGAPEVADALRDIARFLRPSGWGEGERANRCQGIAPRLCGALLALRVDAEADYVAFLGSNHPPTVMAAAHALAALGSVASVPALREAEERSGWLSPVRGAARVAVQHIQHRAGVGRGGLSLVDMGMQEGALSMAESTPAPDAVDGSVTRTARARQTESE